MTEDEIIAVVQAHKDGKKIECKDKNKICNIFEVTDNPIWDFPNYDYRIAPTPVLRPWKPEEVPVGAQVRAKDASWTCLIIGKNCDDFCTPIFNDKNECHSFREALEDMEHSLDNGKTWLPCGVMEEQK